MNNEKVTMEDAQKRMQEMGIINLDVAGKTTPEELMSTLDEIEQMRRRRTKACQNQNEISQEQLVERAKAVLESPFWIPDLKTEEFYERLHDDNDGSELGLICVCIGKDGDIWVKTDPNSLQGLLRFRTLHGGGQSPRVRNALMLLALAIQLDNEEKPQK